MCLTVVAEDETNSWLLCCGTIHVYVALIFFVLFDLMVLVIGILLYTLSVKEQGDWTNVIPLVALIISLFLYISGPIGLLRESQHSLCLYLSRLVTMAIFSLAFALTCFFHKSTHSTIWAGIIWFLMSFPYWCGACLCGRSMDFLTNTYRGYDYGTPNKKYPLLTFGGQLTSAQEPTVTAKPNSGETEAKTASREEPKNPEHHQEEKKKASFEQPNPA